MKQVVRIATRQSKLALWQANFIKDQLLQAHSKDGVPTISVELVGMTTKGDRWLDAPLSEIGGKGLFVKELEAAMLDGRADIAVHSAKDLPAVLPDEFVLPVVGFRAPVQDVLVSRHGNLKDLPQAAKVGSSSLRRQAQLLAQRDDLQLLPIRGNVDTRLAKLDAGEFDAIVLAAAGIGRLQLAVEGLYDLPIEMCLPAPGQGALAIECAANNDVIKLLEPLRDAETELCVAAERGISQGLGADCSLPIAALATLASRDAEDMEIELQSLIASADGKQILQATARGSSPEKLAAACLQQLFDQGAQQILDSLVSAQP